MNDAYEARSEFYARARESRASIEYVRRHGLDMKAIERDAGAFTVLRVAYPCPDRFDFGGPDDVPSVVIQAHDESGVFADLVAWPIDAPGRFATMFGRVPMLGEGAVQNPATYFLGRPLRLYRTPLAWLQAGCEGAACILDPRAAAWRLLDPLGPIACDDARHQREVRTLLRSVADAVQLVVPAPSDRRANA